MGIIKCGGFSPALTAWIDHAPFSTARVAVVRVRLSHRLRSSIPSIRRENCGISSKFSQPARIRYRYRLHGRYAYGRYCNISAYYPLQKGMTRLPTMTIQNTDQTQREKVFSDMEPPKGLVRLRGAGLPTRIVLLVRLLLSTILVTRKASL